MLKPFESHNWMLLYRMNSRMDAFMEFWFYLHADEEKVPWQG